MNIFHLLFFIAAGFLLVALFEINKLFRLRIGKSEANNRGRLTVIIFSILIGTFLLFSSILGAFFERPYWFTEKLYWVVEKVVDVFTLQGAADGRGKAAPLMRGVMR